MVASGFLAGHWSLTGWWHRRYDLGSDIRFLSSLLLTSRWVLEIHWDARWTVSNWVSSTSYNITCLRAMYKSVLRREKLTYSHDITEIITLKLPIKNVLYLIYCYRYFDWVFKETFTWCLAHLSSFLLDSISLDLAKYYNTKAI